MTFRIVVESSSFERASSGNVAGIVYAIINDKPFPDQGWWDFPCLVLGAWFREMDASAQHSVVLRFMDGPAAIKCERVGEPSPGYLAMVPFFDRHPPLTLETSHVREVDVAAEIRRAAVTTLEACQERQLPDQGLSVIVADAAEP